MRWAMSVSPYSFRVERGNVGLVSAMYRMGWSPGLTFWYDGGVGMSDGNCFAAREMADCTSRAAASMSRFSTKVRVISVRPCELVEIMVSTPAIVENWRSSGVATEEAIVSGTAPG
jgi:hypothetical protein